MHTCPVCKIDLPDRLLSCPKCEGVRLELVLPEAAGTIEVTGRVVTARERSPGGAAPWALQLQLLDFDAEKQKTIRDLLASGPESAELDLEQEVGDTSLAGLVSRWDFSEPAEDS
jgi:hypothetical protein